MLLLKLLINAKQNKLKWILKSRHLSQNINQSAAPATATATTKLSDKMDEVVQLLEALVRFPMGSLGLLIDLILSAALGPWVRVSL